MNQILTATRHGFGKIDKVLLAFALILIAIWSVSLEQGVASVQFVGWNVLKISPFLILSASMAAYATASGADSLIARAFSGSMPMMILMGALAGALSPFCSCGVIPLIAALLAMRTPLPPVMAFWLASPVIDPSMFVLTGATLGFDFAAYKLVSAVLMGVAGGAAAWALVQTGMLGEPLKEGVGNGGCGGAKVRNPGQVVWKFWHEPGRVEKFKDNAKQTFVFLLRWLMLAYLLESLLVVLLPAEVLLDWVGGEGPASVALATLIGVPAYLNGYAALPLVNGLIDQGMNPGAGMAFLLAGGVTSFPAAMAVFALVRLRVFALYLVVALAMSFVLGMGFQAMG